MDIQETNKSVNGKNRKILSKRSYVNTEDKLRLFLEFYGKEGRIIRAAEAAGVSFNTHYRKLREDSEYRAAFEETEQHAAQHIEDALFTRALDGDVQAAHILLKRFRPELYRERVSTDVTVTVNLADRIKAADQRMLELKRNDVTNSAPS